ncbi:MAG: hypothetical protein JWN44_482 [Myxococcales bacterium]|nr:hypothetical protein [Myxococcales bacterium]
MIRSAAMLGLGALLLAAAPANACPADRAGFPEAPTIRFATWTVPIDGVDPVAEDSIHLAVDDDAVEAAYLAEEQATAQAMRAWMQSLASGLIALLTVALAAVGLARLGSARRPLAMTVLARRPVPAAVVLSLLSPVVPPLVLMHAEREILPSPVLLMASAGAALALSMLMSRRRLAARLRWAVMGVLGGHSDGTLVLTEIEPKKLVAPPGARGRVPWFVADLAASAGGESARVALGQADVDDGAARLLSRLANGGLVAGETLTVLGATQRVPADAASADPLCREAPMMARIGRSSCARAVISAGTPADLLRRLQLECVLLAVLFGICAGSAALAFFN